MWIKTTIVRIVCASFCSFLASTALSTAKANSQPFCQSLYAGGGEVIRNGFEQITTPKLRRRGIGDNEMGDGLSRLRIFFTSIIFDETLTSLDMRGYLYIDELDGDHTSYTSKFSHKVPVPSQAGCKVIGHAHRKYKVRPRWVSIGDLDAMESVYGHLDHTTEEKSIINQPGEGMIKEAFCILDVKGKEDGRLWCSMKVLPVLVEYEPI